MSDIFAGFVVTLDKSLHEEDLEQLKTAMLMLKGVVSVDPVVDNSEMWIARERVRHEFQEKIREALIDILTR